MNLKWVGQLRAPFDYVRIWPFRHWKFYNEQAKFAVVNSEKQDKNMQSIFCFDIKQQTRFFFLDAE